MACFGFGSIQVKEKPVYPFTNFVLKVDEEGGGWEKTVAKVLKKTKEVANFMMHDGGMMQVSGTVDPVVLLKVLAKSGKEAQLVGWKFGGCSRNLHMPEFQHYLAAAAYNKYYGYDGGYGGANYFQNYGGGGRYYHNQHGTGYAAGPHAYLPHPH